ncbi:MAG: pilus assembly protein, partial [Myxococcaceae bacterium]
DYTPLTGSLKDAKAYIQTVIDSDPYAGCGRAYYVMLLTDGEEQPAGLPGNDPVGAVTALRNMTTSSALPVDVKTFVIGFGLFTPSPQLNSMAQAGGTAVNATDLSTLDLSAAGVAFDGSTPARLLSSLEGAFGRILEGYFTRSKPAVNVAGTEMYVGYFRLLFNGLEWQGKLDAINTDSINLPTLADTVTDAGYNYLWRYGDPDTAPLPSSSINKQNSRTVYTSLDPSSGNRIFFDYTGCIGCATGSGWNSNAPADQSALEARITGVPEDARLTIALLLNPGKNEQFTNGIFKRSRASDIFHSDPAIIEGAVQSASWPDGTESGAYTTFRTNVQSRKKTVYIGANDGMLHAVEDAVTSPGAVVDPIAGSERWAYVPMMLHPTLASMRDFHTFGVDGSVAVADVCGAGFSASPCTAPDGWRTLLVGAFGRGARGLYALDITDPSNPQPKWETNGAPPGVPRFGHTWGAPVVARATVGGLGKLWSVFVGGGVLPAPDPQGHAFYVLDARTGALLDDGTSKASYDVWDDPADPTVNAVASRPTLYRPADKSMVERVFFNDTEGKVWRMNTTGSALASWAVSPGVPGPGDAFFDPANASGNSACMLDVNGNPTPVLDATTGTPVMVGATPMTLPLSAPRPKIFNRPMLALDQTGLLNVYVGTGDTDHPNDPLGTWDYFYGLTDTGTGCARPLFVLRFAQNEKMLADPAFLNGVVFATTYLPPAANICTDAGDGFLYAFDARTGQPVATIKNPLTGLMVAKVGLSAVNPQLKGSGIPSAPIIRNGKLYLSVETAPSHPRQVDLGSRPIDVKVKTWQRVK